MLRYSSALADSVPLTGQLESRMGEAGPKWMAMLSLLDKHNGIVQELSKASIA